LARRYLKVEGNGHFALDQEQIKAEERYDGIWVLRTNTDYNAETVAHVYKALLPVPGHFSHKPNRSHFYKYQSPRHLHFCRVEDRLEGTNRSIDRHAPDRENTSCALSLPSTHLHVAWMGRALWLRTRIRAKAEWSAIVLS
jgi:hypothetical protein